MVRQRIANPLSPVQIWVLPLQTDKTRMGRRQVVRHRVLIPTFRGSNPLAPEFTFVCFCDENSMKLIYLSIVMMLSLCKKHKSVSLAVLHLLCEARQRESTTKVLQSTFLLRTTSKKVLYFVKVRR